MLATSCQTPHVESQTLHFISPMPCFKSPIEFFLGCIFRHTYTAKRVFPCVWDPLSFELQIPRWQQRHLARTTWFGAGTTSAMPIPSWAIHPRAPVPSPRCAWPGPKIHWDVGFTWFNMFNPQMGRNNCYGSFFPMTRDCNCHQLSSMTGIATSWWSWCRETCFCDRVSSSGFPKMK